MTTYSAEDIAAIRAQGDLRQMWADIGAQTRSEKAHRRAMVLAHPDLAKRLTEAPIDFARPEQWCGYIAGEIWQGQRNRSSIRAALLEIVAEAEARAAKERTP